MQIAMAVKEELTKSMSSFGFMIIQTLVTDIEPDHKVKDAMNEINSAQRFRFTFMASFTTESSADFFILVQKMETKCDI